MTVPTRCLGVAAGLLTDRLAGEPAAPIHPVVWFGRSMGRVEALLWADRRLPGVVYAAVGLGQGVVVGRLVRSTSSTVAVAVAGRELRRVAGQIGRAVNSGDLAGARAALPALVGRDPTELDESGIAAAVIESLAENSVDAVIAPAFWALVAGAPGAAAYRAVNTMDSMVGHQNNRYRNFGWAAARLDDVANYLPARIFALLVAVQKPSLTRKILAIVRRDAAAHPSPNAGVAEAAVAASISRELGGSLRYGPSVENRPTLGSGRRPTPADIDRAISIVNRVELTTIALLVTAWALATIRRLK